MPRECVGGQSPRRGEGWSEDFWPVGLSLSKCGHVFANSVRYIEDITWARGDAKFIFESEIFFNTTREDKFRISKRPCKFLFVI